MSTATHNVAARLEAVFSRIQRERMRDVPLINPALRVEAVGLRIWESDWLGVLITPWFINLVLLPRDAARPGRDPNTASAERFPLGVFDFLPGHHAGLGPYRSCTLFSPVMEFRDQEAARLAAGTALDALFARPDARSPAKLLSRRAFLRGEFGMPSP